MAEQRDAELIADPGQKKRLFHQPWLSSAMLTLGLMAPAQAETGGVSSAVAEQRVAERTLQGSLFFVDDVSSAVAEQRDAELNRAIAHNKRGVSSAVAEQRDAERKSESNGGINEFHQPWLSSAMLN